MYRTIHFHSFLLRPVLCSMRRRRVESARRAGLRDALRPDTSPSPRRAGRVKSDAARRRRRSHAQTFRSLTAVAATVTTPGGLSEWQGEHGEEPSFDASEHRGTHNKHTMLREALRYGRRFWTGFRLILSRSVACPRTERFLGAALAH